MHTCMHEIIDNGSTEEPEIEKYAATVPFSHNYPIVRKRLIKIETISPNQNC